MSEAEKGAGGNGQEDAGELQFRYLELARLRPGETVLGRYRVERLIGKGGFGLVFAATDQTLKAPVALKFLDPQSLRDERKFLRVQREITLSRRIGDPRIVRIYSLESWRGIWFTVMERIAGQTLKERLQAEGPFSWESFRPLFAEVLAGVGSLHAEGIIHRDLKPSNIMVDGSGKVKILDFGLAKEIGDTEKTSSVGEIVGSPFYLSPEQIRGLELGVGSDIYQLGILLYQCLTGSIPFPDTTTMSLVLMHLSQKPDRLRDRGARVPEGVEFAVAKALAKRPRDRFRSAAEMAERLRRERAPLLPSLLRRVPGALRLAAVAAAALLLLAFAYFKTYGSRQVHAVTAEGTAVQAVNRCGRSLWRKDFAPFSVHLAHLVRAPGSWYRPHQQNPVQNINDAFLARLQDLPAPLVMAFLSNPGKGVFARDGSINSDRFDNQLALLDGQGKRIGQKSYFKAFDLNAYDFAPVFTMSTFSNFPARSGREKMDLFRLQNFQGMYPSALLAANGTSFAVFTSPGTILDAQVLRNDSRGGSLLMLTANNLLSHMACLAEWNFSPLSENRLDMFPNYSQDPGLTFREFVAMVPSSSRIIENRWRDRGWARLTESIERKIIRVHRDGRLEVDDGGRISTYRDDAAVLAKAYGLINECFQQKTARRNPDKALELIAKAVDLPIQNPYLLSALLNLKGDCQVSLGRYAEGKRDLREALRHFPPNNDAMNRLLEIAFLEKGAPAAIDLFQRSYSNSRSLYGLGITGNWLFLGNAHLAAGQPEKSKEYFEMIFQQKFPDAAEPLRAILDLHSGNYPGACELLARAEGKVPGFFDIRELRLLLARGLVLAERDLGRCRWILEDLAKFSLRQGHMAEVSLCCLLAREGKTSEARERIAPAFAALKKAAVGDLETRLWFWYDAFIFARTMELLGDSAGAREGYRACIEANPHTALAAAARAALKRR